MEDFLTNNNQFFRGIERWRDIAEVKGFFY